MAKFPITTARQELGFTPTRSVRANIDVRTGEGAVGEAIGQGALQLTKEHLAREKVKTEQRRRAEEKRQQMTDANSAVLAKGFRDTEDLRMSAFRDVNPQEDWEKETIRGAGEVATQVSELNGSDDFHVNQSVRSEVYSNVQAAKAFTASTRQLREDTTEALTGSMTAAFRSRDPIQIKDATGAFVDNGANMGKDKAEVLSDIKIAMEAGKKLANKDAVDVMRQAASLDPQAVIDQMNLLKESRKQGVQDTSALTNTDIDSIIRSAEDREVQLLAKAQADINAKNTALETELHNDIRSGDASITDVAISGLPAATQRRLENDLDDENKRDIESSWAIQDSQDATVGTREILLSIEGGQVDINEARNTLSQLSRRKTDDGRSIVSKDTFDKTMDKIAKGGRDAVDLFTDEQTAIVSNALVGRLTEQQARNKIRFEAGTMSGIEKRQFSTSGFLLQVAKHQEILYNNGLAQRLRTLGIEDTSGKEAKAEAVKVWSAIKHKPLETQINDFLFASGQKLENPQGFPQATWDAADARNKATIVNAVSQGFNNKQILEAINQ